MQYTSAQANQLLLKLVSEHQSVCSEEDESCIFVAATTEKLEDARPPYDYAETRSRLAELERKIRKIKHAISVFNATHTVLGFDMTADELLNYLRQLKERTYRLSHLAFRLQKRRLDTSARSNLIEYSYANYDVKAAKAEYFAVKDEIARAQLALDAFNNSETMEIDL